MLRLFSASLLAILWFCVPASAEEVDCENAMAQVELNYCEDQAYQAADAELNAAWAEARQTARQTDQDLPENLRGAEDALVRAQRAWITFRDAECEVAGFEARGGSMEPMLIYACLADLTRKRTAELKTFVERPAEE